jgi:hypothetical protein
VVAVENPSAVILTLRRVFNRPFPVKKIKAAVNNAPNAPKALTMVSPFDQMHYYSRQPANKNEATDKSKSVQKKQSVFDGQV